MSTFRYNKKLDISDVKKVILKHIKEGKKSLLFYEIDITCDARDWIEYNSGFNTSRHDNKICIIFDNNIKYPLFSFARKAIKKLPVKKNEFTEEELKLYVNNCIENGKVYILFRNIISIDVLKKYAKEHGYTLEYVQSANFSAIRGYVMYGWCSPERDYLLEMEEFWENYFRVDF